ncbi:MAG: RagB/SusD family nutrient uptake outer membrane protein [Pedobacter sp.]|nr:MAG: RagB/SusD family nutrient uptake outer membrane protein [Pedobacter sp.]
MKAINKIFALLLLAGIGFGCNKKLDIRPEQNITPEQITTGNDVKAVLFGAYSLLQGPGGFGEGYILPADLLANSNHIGFVGTFAPYRDLAAKRQISTNSVAATIWANSYSIINIANTVIDKLPLVDESERDIVDGEAKFFRGVAYLQLVNYFAQPYFSNPTGNLGVPIITQPTYQYDPVASKVSRNTVAQVYAQILADLNDAKDKLEEVSDVGRATRFSALGFLSRVHLNMRNYQLAAESADEVIESGAFRLNASYLNAFNNTNYSSEDVFGILQTSQSNSGTSNNGMNTFYAAYSLEPPFISGRGDVQPNPAYYNLFENSDFRGGFLYEGYNIAGVEGIYTRKFQQFYRVIPVIRLAELYLTRGEANLRGGTSIGPNSPAADLDEVRFRAGASFISRPITPDDFVQERFRELGFEGDRLWTLKRLGLTVGGRPATDPILVLPIPQRETDVNKNLVQNPGYL